MAIIGQSTYREGDALDAAGDVRIKRIERDGVVFSYRGEEIKLKFQ